MAFKFHDLHPSFTLMKVIFVVDFLALEGKEVVDGAETEQDDLLIDRQEGGWMGLTDQP